MQDVDASLLAKVSEGCLPASDQDESSQAPEPERHEADMYEMQ
jgi:hypothetical protein